MAISRPTITDDSGDGLTGTIFNAAFWADIFDRIDAVLDPLTLTGHFFMTTGFRMNIGVTVYPGRTVTNPTNAINIYDGTAPSGTMANGITLYSTAGELRVMDAAGNATLLSPHDALTNEWIFDSVDSVTGKGIRIDMERLMRALDAHLGGGFIHERAGRVCRRRRPRGRRS